MFCYKSIQVFLHTVNINYFTKRFSYIPIQHLNSRLHVKNSLLLTLPLGRPNLWRVPSLPSRVPTDSRFRFWDFTRRSLRTLMTTQQIQKKVYGEGSTYLYPLLIELFQVRPITRTPSKPRMYMTLFKLFWFWDFKGVVNVSFLSSRDRCWSLSHLKLGPTQNWELNRPLLFITKPQSQSF